ncbi:hypothetical protein O4H66_07020 [Comamonadaceae bacterium G21597-S1]|nr:hypothetical protein [Comamonadaceae bacterium G21597-S1]
MIRDSTHMALPAAIGRPASHPMSRLTVVSVVLALFAGPAAAEASNAVVIDFDQGRLILGWLALWLVAALTFGLCADRRIQLMTRLANYLEHRARQRASARADAQLRELALSDPRMMTDLLAAIDRGQALQAQAIDMATGDTETLVPAPAVTAKPARAPATAPGRPRPARGFRAAPLPGLPSHLQYLPG